MTTAIQPAGSRSMGTVRLLNMGSGLAILAILLIVTSLLLRERQSAEAVASRAASNIVQLIDLDVQRTVDLYDSSLQGLVSATKRSDLSSLPRAVRHQLLFNRAITPLQLGDLLWVDKQGRLVADSTSLTVRSANFADTPDFIEQRDNRQLGLRISRPFKARLGNLGWCVSFSRRIEDASGNFMGIAAGALRLSYFDGLFKSLDVGVDGSVSLVSTEGILLARQPGFEGEDMIGRDFSQSPKFKLVLDSREGRFTTDSSIDRHERLYSYARVGDLPLVVVVALSTDEVFAPWRRSALLVGTATVLLCLGIFSLSRLLGRELRSRQRAEHDLRELATTDSLTGLANRRRLDQQLASEWSRALRTGRPLSVLMIDVDHFRSYNERFGHPGGDQALRQVARAIRQSIRRPADIAARYGGEEFLVILPETDINGAMIIAESIRQAVESGSAHNLERRVTVSIGLGSRSTTGTSSQALLSAADAALYQAKHNGRNQVVYIERDEA